MSSIALLWTQSTIAGHGSYIKACPAQQRSASVWKLLQVSRASSLSNWYTFVGGNAKPECVNSGRHCAVSLLFALRCIGLGGFSPIASRRASGRFAKSLLQICHAGLEEWHFRFLNQITCWSSTCGRWCHFDHAGECTWLHLVTLGYTLHIFRSRDPHEKPWKSRSVTSSTNHGRVKSQKHVYEMVTPMRQCTCILCHSLGILSFASSPLLGQGGLQWAQFLRVSQTKTETPQHPQLYPSPSLGVASDYTIRGEPKQSDSHTHTPTLWIRLDKLFRKDSLGTPASARVTILRRATSQLWPSLWTSSTATLSCMVRFNFHGHLGWLMFLWSLQGLTERYWKRLSASSPMPRTEQPPDGSHWTPLTPLCQI